MKLNEIPNIMLCSISNESKQIIQCDGRGPKLSDGFKHTASVLYVNDIRPATHTSRHMSNASEFNVWWSHMLNDVCLTFKWHEMSSII